MLVSRTKEERQQTLFSLMIVARDMMCFVVGNKGSAGVKNFVNGFAKQTISLTTIRYSSYYCFL